jgi:hypothetical protein
VEAVVEIILLEELDLEAVLAAAVQRVIKTTIAVIIKEEQAMEQ